MPPIDGPPAVDPAPPPTLRNVPFLPLDATLSDGTPVHYRALTHADVDDLYAAFLANIQLGHGYELIEMYFTPQYSGLGGKVRFLPGDLMYFTPRGSGLGIKSIFTIGFMIYAFSLYA